MLDLNIAGVVNGAGWSGSVQAISVSQARDKILASLTALGAEGWEVVGQARIQTLGAGGAATNQLLLKRPMV